MPIIVMLTQSLSAVVILGLFISTRFADVGAIALDSSPDVNLDPYPGKPRVTFNPSKTFKITVFSDLHFGENPWDDWGPEQDHNTLQLMRTVLADEEPDYVVLNGDLITGENTFRENSTKLIDEIVAPLNEFGVKFSSTHGNHDNQANITHLEEIQRELLVAPNSYTRLAPQGVGGEYGPGNYWVPVFTKATDPTPSLILWFFDSRSGFEEGSGATPIPDWVDSSVADWIERETAAMNRAWGPAEERSAIAFVHIPPHAIQALQSGLDSDRNPGLNEDALGPGSVQATTNPGDNGKDDPFWSSLNTNVKNLRVVVSGHDHGNEWCAREPTQNVIFCFDKHSGYGGYSGFLWGHGVRNIVIRSPDPSSALDTWIRLEDGEIWAKVVLDQNYH